MFVGPAIVQVSLPVDPTALFCGTVVEESEVLPSKQAPVMLVCAWASTCPISGMKSGEIEGPVQGFMMFHVFQLIFKEF